MYDQKFNSSQTFSAHEHFPETIIRPNIK